MRKQLLITIGIFVLSISNCQVPQSFNFQGVLKEDGATGIYKKNTVAVIVKIIQGSPEGVSVLEEVHSTTINDQGMFSIQIGSISTENFSLIDWANGPYYLNINVNGTDFGTTQLISVPYAMYAQKSGNGFSGSYNDLQNIPEEFNPVVHSHSESEILDLYHYTDDDIDGVELAFTNWDKDVTDDFSGSFSDLSGIPENIDTDKTDDFDGDYNNLTNRPTELSDFNNDLGFITTEIDGDINNEIQYLSVSTIGDTLFLSESNFVIIPNISQANSNPDFEPEEYWFDSRNGEFYKTVQIGSQIWMAENLNYKTSSSWYYNNDSLAYSELYGVLYDWNVARNICPDGWHLPTESEITSLMTYLGGSSVAGGKLKEEGTEHWLSPNTGATNESGFNALPGGNYNSTGDTFIDIGSDCTFWINKEVDVISAYRVILHYTTSEAYPMQSLSKTSGASVRCIKD